MTLTRRNRTEPAADPTQDTRDFDCCADNRANLDHAYGRIQDLSERNQGLDLEVKQLVEDLALVAREYDDLSTRALPHLGTSTWPQVAPVRAVICDETAVDLDFEGWWEDGDPEGIGYLAERLPSRQEVSA